MAKTVGYSLIEDTQPELAGARAALAKLGVPSGQIYTDTDPRGRAQDRPGLRSALAACRPRDVLAAPSLGRLAVSLSDLEQMTDMIINAEVTLNIGGVVFDPANDEGRSVYDSFLHCGASPCRSAQEYPKPVNR